MSGALSTSVQPKANCVIWCNETNSITQTQRNYLKAHGRSQTACYFILRWSQNCRKHGPVQFNKLEDVQGQLRNVNKVGSYFNKDPRRSLCQFEMIQVFHGAQFTQFFCLRFVYLRTEFDVFKNAKSVIVKHGLLLLYSVWKIVNRKIISSTGPFFLMNVSLCARKGEKT